MTDWRDSSVTVRTARWLGQDSIVAGACRAVWRRLALLDAALARASADKDGREDDERVREVLRGSRIFKAIDRLFAAPALAWEGSRTRTVVESTRSAFLSLPMWQRVRLIGWMVLVALVTRILLYLFSRAPVTTITLLFWALVAGVSALMMLAPHPVAAAWIDGRARHPGGK